MVGGCLSRTAITAELDENGQQKRLGVGSKLQDTCSLWQHQALAVLPRCWGCSVPCAPGAPTALLIQPCCPQVLCTGGMCLLLVALCLAQGLEDAIPDAEVVHNPEAFMNIVSAGGALHFPTDMPQVLPKAPAQLTPSLHLHQASFRGLGHQKFPIFALLSLTSCPQLELGLSLLSL